MVWTSCCSVLRVPAAFLWHHLSSSIGTFIPACRAAAILLCQRDGCVGRLGNPSASTCSFAAFGSCVCQCHSPRYLPLLCVVNWTKVQQGFGEQGGGIVTISGLPACELLPQGQGSVCPTSAGVGWCWLGHPGAIPSFSPLSVATHLVSPHPSSLPLPQTVLSA